MDKALQIFKDKSVVHPNSNYDNRYLTKENTEEAYIKIFDVWKVDMTNKQETDFKRRRFNPVWNALQKDNKLDYTESMKLLKLMLTVKA